MIWLFCFMLIGCYIYSHFIKVQNIFDQMYYNRVESGSASFFRVSHFDTMPQIDGHRQWGRTADYEGVFENNYKEEYLNPGEYLAIDCNKNIKKLSISATKQFNGFRLFYGYTYDLKNKEITEVVGCRYNERYSGVSNEYLEDYNYTENLGEILKVIEEARLTKDDLLQYKKYFLYDKLLTDWLDANSSRFSVERWGRVKFIEVLY